MTVVLIFLTKESACRGRVAYSILRHRLPLLFTKTTSRGIRNQRTHAYTLQRTTCYIGLHVTLQENCQSLITFYYTIYNICICKYEIFLDNLLKHVDIPTDVFNAASTEVSSKNSLDRFCGDIINCIKLAVSTVIPQRKCHYDRQFNVPGWNTYVKEKHDFAREAYLNWVHSGKPKFGNVFDNMKRSRAVFKLAVGLR